MQIKKSALKKLIYEMLLTESRRAEEWISKIKNEEERQAYQAAYDAGVQNESDLRWIQKVRGGEPVEDIVGDILQFRKENVQNIISVLKEPKDLFGYKSVGELRRVLDQVHDLEKEKIDYAEAFQSEINVRKIATVGPWTILMPLTVRGSSSCDISGKDTTWCTTKRSGQNLFYSYVGRYGDDIILFYIMDYNRKPLNPYKMQNIAGVEDNDSRMCVGYINGYPHLRGENGGVSVDAANVGLREDDLERLLGSDYEKIMNILGEVSDEIAGQHPAKNVMERATENPALFRHLIKDYGYEETIDFFNGMLDYGVSDNVLEVFFEKFKKFHDKFINKSKKEYEDFIVNLFQFFEDFPHKFKSEQIKDIYCNKIMEEHIFRALDYYEINHAGLDPLADESVDDIGLFFLDAIERLYNEIIENINLSHSVKNKIIEYGKNSKYNIFIDRLLKYSNDVEFISEYVINNLLSDEKSALESFSRVFSALMNKYITDKPGDYTNTLSDSQKQAMERMVSVIFEKYVVDRVLEKTTDKFNLSQLSPENANIYRLGMIKAISGAQITSQDILEKIFIILNDSPRKNRVEEKEYKTLIKVFTDNKNLGSETIQKIIESDDPFFRSELASQSNNLTEQQFQQLAADPFLDVRLGVATNIYTPQKVLESLVTSNTAITYRMFDNPDSSRSGRLLDHDSKEVSKAVVNNPKCTMRALIRAYQLHGGYVENIEPRLLKQFGVAMLKMAPSDIKNIVIQKLKKYNTSGEIIGTIGARSFEEISGNKCDELIRELKEIFRIPEKVEFTRQYRANSHYEESFYWFYRHQEPKQVVKIQEGKPAVPIPREEWSYDNVEVVPEITAEEYLASRGQEQYQFKIMRKGQ